MVEPLLLVRDIRERDGKWDGKWWDGKLLSHNLLSLNLSSYHQLGHPLAASGSRIMTHLGLR